MKRVGTGVSEQVRRDGEQMQVDKYVYPHVRLFGFVAGEGKPFWRGEDVFLSVNNR
jgi:hypothetical protein